MKTIKNLKILSTKRIFILYSIVIIIVLSSAYLFFSFDENIIKSDKQMELKAIADLKVSQISVWYKERLSDAKYFSTNPLIINHINDLIRSDNLPSARTKISGELSRMNIDTTYNNLIITAPDGKIIYSMNQQPGIPDPIVASSIKKASLNKEIISTDLYYSAPDKSIYLDFIAPIINNGKVIGTIIFRVDPDNYLYPLINKWPVPSKTSETLVVKKEGDSVLFLNELSKRKNTALKLKIPLDRTEVPAVQSILGRTGIFEGVSYAGTNVLAYISPVPNTSWKMIAIEDTQEIYADLYYRGKVILGFTLLLIIVLSFGLAWYYHFRQRNIYKELFVKETEMRQYHEEFRTILYSIGDGVITTDINGAVKQMNIIAEELTGWREREAKGRPIEEIFKIVLEDTRDKVVNPVHRVLKEGAIVGLANHTLLISRNGKETPIADSGAPIRNDNGKVEGVVLVFRDKTEEHESEEIIHKSEARLKRAEIASKSGNWELHLDSKIMIASEGASVIYGINKNAFDYETIKTVPLPEYRSLLDVTLKNLIERDLPYNIEFKIKSIDSGIIKDIHSTAQYDRSNRVIFGVIHDITEQKIAQSALTESEEKMRLIVEGTPYLFFYTQDNNLNITYISPSVEKITGYSALQWKEQREWFLTDAEINQIARERTQKHLNGEYIKEPLLLEMHHANGSNILLEIYENPVLKDNKVISLQGIARDITDRKKAEENIIKLNRIYAVISQINQSIVRTKDKDNLLREACKIAIDFGKFQMAWIGMIDEETKNVLPYTFAGFEEKYLSSIVTISVLDIPEGRGPTGVAIRDGIHVICNDIENDSNMNLWRKEALDRNYKSSISLPIKIFGKAIGAFTLYSSVPYFFDKEEIDLLDEVASDISFALEAIETEKKRKEAEETLRKWASFFENADWGVVAPSEDLKTFDLMNPVFARMLGYSIEELKGRDIMDIFPLDEQAFFLKQLPIAHMRGHHNFESKHIRKDGTIFPVQINITILKDQDGLVLFRAVNVQDITERKRAEEALKQSEETYRTLFNNTQVGMFRTMLDGSEILNANNKFLEIFGQKKEDVIGKPSVIHWADPKERDEMVKLLKLNKRVNDFECKMLDKNGGIRDCITSLTLNPNGNTLDGSIIDITERKKAIEEQAQSEMKYRSLIETTDTGFVIVDTDGNILDANKEYLRITGFETLTQILGRNVTEWTAEYDRERNHKEIAKCFEQGYVRNLIVDYISSNGNIIPIELNATLVKIYNKPIIISLCRDISERRQMEEALRESEEKFRRIFEEHSAVKFLLDPETGNIIDANKSAAKFYGWPLEELKHMNMSELNTAGSDYIKKQMEKVILGHENHFEFKHKLKDGTIKDVEIFSSKIIINNKHYLHSIIHDITDRKIAEEELLKYRDHLENLVETRTEELDKLNTDLIEQLEKEKELEMLLKQSLGKEKELNELRKQFISTASHEFRTPLTSILSSTELIERYMHNGNEEKIDDHILRIKKSINYVTNLLDEVLTISKMERGKIEFTPEPTNLKEFCTDILQEITSSGFYKHKLNFEFQPSENKNKVDPKLLKMILTNLLSNAVKYTPPEGAIALNVSQEDGNLIFEVTDSGMGIPEEEKAQLFEPFHRCSNTLEIPGTGLGLSIVKQSVELHNGNLSFESELGKGSVFTVKLPVIK